MAHPWETDYTKIYHHHTYPAISPTRPELSVSGKTIVISGGGRGLGTGIVDAFAQAGAAHIFVTGRNAANLQAVASKTEAAHPSSKIVVVPGDISREEDVSRLFAEVKKVAPGGVDVFVANAGYMADTVPVAQAQVDDWWRAFEVNIKGVFFQARHFLAAAAPNAAFVNISAGAAHLAPPLFGFSAYASAKLAAARVVETLQVENPALRFFNVQPGVVKTDMLTKSGFEGFNPPPPTVLQLTCVANFACGWSVQRPSSGNKLVTGLVGWVV